MLKLSHSCPGCGTFIDVDVDSTIRNFWFPEHRKNPNPEIGFVLQMSVICGCGTAYDLDGPFFNYIYTTMFKDFLSHCEEP